MANYSNLNKHCCCINFIHSWFTLLSSFCNFKLWVKSYPAPKKILFSSNTSIIPLVFQLILMTSCLELKTCWLNLWMENWKQEVCVSDDAKSAIQQLVHFSAISIDDSDEWWWMMNGSGRIWRRLKWSENFKLPPFLLFFLFKWHLFTWNNKTMKKWHLNRTKKKDNGKAFSADCFHSISCQQWP